MENAVPPEEVERLLAEKTSELRTCMVKITNLEKSVADLQAVLQNSNQSSQSTLSEMESKLASLQSENFSLKQENDKLNAALISAGEQSKNSESSLNDQLKKLQETLKASENLNKTHEATLSSHDESWKLKNNKLMQLEAELETLKKDNGKLAPKSELKEQEDRFRDELARLTASHKKQLHKIESLNKDLKSNLAQSEEQNVTLMGKKDSLEAKIAKQMKLFENSEQNWKKRVGELENIISTDRENWGGEKLRMEETIRDLMDELDKLRNKETVPSGSKFKMYVDLKKDNRQLEKELEKTKVQKKSVGGKKGEVKGGGSGAVEKGVERSGSAPTKKNKSRGAPPSEVRW